MTPAKFRAALAELSLSVEDFSTYTGTHRATVFRALNRDPVPLWMERIVTLLLERQKLAANLSKPPAE